MACRYGFHAEPKSSLTVLVILQQSTMSDQLTLCLQAEYACNLDRAEAIMSHNAQELAEGDRRSNLGGPPPMWLNMLGTAVSAELRAPGEAVPARNTNPVRCTIM